MDAVDGLLRQWRKKRLWSLVTEDTEWLEFRFGQIDLHKLLPHRSPFLLCQELQRFAPVGLADSPPGILLGQSYLDPADPIFAGHFPNFPLYPGVLQIEMLGQLALCLGYFQEQQRLGWPQGIVVTPQQLHIRASKVLGAHYLRPVRPGQIVELQACQLGESDGFFAKMLGQLLVDGQVAMVCAQEVCFVD